jgi:hypothetical protein
MLSSDDARIVDGGIARVRDKTSSGGFRRTENTTSVLRHAGRAVGGCEHLLNTVQALPASGLARAIISGPRSRWRRRLSFC